MIIQGKIMTDALEKVFFKQKYNWNIYGFNLSPSWLNTCINCPFKFKCAKILKIERYQKDRNELFNGRLAHKLFEISPDYYDFKILQDYFNEYKVRKHIIEICYNLIPKKYRPYFPNIFEMVKNYAEYEYNRIDRIFDLEGATKEAFERFVKPILREKEQTDLCLRHGIRFFVDVGYRMPPYYFDDNNREELMLGDYKTGTQYGEFLADDIKLQLTFPIPFLRFTRIPRYVTGIYVGLQGLKDKYHKVEASDFTNLKLIFDQLLNRIRKDDFEKTYKFCNWCDFAAYCVSTEITKIEYRLQQYRVLQAGMNWEKNDENK